MKKYLIALALLAVAAPVRAATIDPVFVQKQLYGFMDNHYYDAAGTLTVYGLMNQTYFLVDGTEVYKQTDGSFSQSAPVPVVAPIVDALPAPDISTGISTTTPVMVVTPPTPAQTPAPVVFVPAPLINVCTNIAGSTPVLPPGMVVIGGQCVLLASTTPDSYKVDLRFSYSTDGQNFQSVPPRTDGHGNTLTSCDYLTSWPTSEGIPTFPPDNLTLPAGTYQWQLGEYQCGVSNLNYNQLYLGVYSSGSYVKP